MKINDAFFYSIRRRYGYILLFYEFKVFMGTLESLREAIPFRFFLTKAINTRGKSSSLCLVANSRQVIVPISELFPDSDSLIPGTLRFPNCQSSDRLSDGQKQKKKKCTQKGGLRTHLFLPEIEIKIKIVASIVLMFCMLPMATPSIYIYIYCQDHLCVHCSRYIYIYVCTCV